MDRTDRKNYERLLLSRAIEKRTLSFMVSQNINWDYFKHYNSVARDIWEKTEEIGILPTLKSASSRFPDFDWSPPDSEDEVREALYFLKQFHAEDLLHKELFDLGHLLKEENGWKKALETLPQSFVGIQNVLNPAQGKDYAGNAIERHGYVVSRAQQRAEGNWRINFAHKEMNEFFGGYEAGLYMYVARLSQGKTHTSLLDLWYTWHEGNKLEMPVNVGIFSLEMAADKVGLQLDTFETHFSNYDLNKGTIRSDSSTTDEKVLQKEEDNYRKFIETLQEESEQGKKGKFRIWTRQELTGKVTPRRIEALLRDEGLDFVVIDQLELVDADSGTTDERMKLNETAREFKNMSGRLNIPILVPHQMNRETLKEKEVTAANIAGSDGPARHADFVCYLTRDKETKMSFYNFLKARNNPSDNKFALKWDYNTGYYQETDPDLGALHDLMDRDLEAMEEEDTVKKENW